MTKFKGAKKIDSRVVIFLSFSNDTERFLDFLFVRTPPLFHNKTISDLIPIYTFEHVF